jgi:DNA-binding CsgD family transcriptional regulator
MLNACSDKTGRDCACRNAAVQHTPGSEIARPRLTPRQREILVAWLKYDTKRLVAQNLFIRPSTVKTHIQRIRKSYAEVGRPAATKIALFIRAVQDGIIDVTDDKLLLEFFADRSGE